MSLFIPQERGGPQGRRESRPERSRARPPARVRPRRAPPRRRRALRGPRGAPRATRAPFAAAALAGAPPRGSPAPSDPAARRRLLRPRPGPPRARRSEEHTSELQSRLHLVCRLLLEKKKKNI